MDAYHPVAFAMPTLDLRKYTEGTFYQQLHIPNSFQSSSARDVTAQYYLMDDRVVVVNSEVVEYRDYLSSCYSLMPCCSQCQPVDVERGQDGVRITASGTARVVSLNMPALFKLSFSRLAYWLGLESDYVVLDADLIGYKWALVTGKSPGKYAWVLTRDPHPSEDVVRQYTASVISHGLNMNDFVRTHHS